LWPADGCPAPVDVFPTVGEQKFSLAFSGMCFMTWKTLGMFGVKIGILCNPLQPADSRLHELSQAPCNLADLLISPFLTTNLFTVFFFVTITHLSLGTVYFCIR
jgi:hypothetical protein